MISKRSVPRKVAAENFIGQKFGRLMVVAGRLMVDGAGYFRPTWLCQCSCGQFVERRGSYLRNVSTGAATLSCGCSFAEIHKPKQAVHLNKILQAHRDHKQARISQRTWYKNKLQKLFEDNCK